MGNKDQYGLAGLIAGVTRFNIKIGEHTDPSVLMLETEVLAALEAVPVPPDLVEALKGARETILHLINQRWSEVEGTDSEWTAEIDAAITLCQAQAAQIGFTATDGQRLLRRSDVEGVCDDPDLCFHSEGSVARCGPCAVKIAARDGVTLNEYTRSNPQAMRLRRELIAAEAKVEELAAQMKGLEAERDGLLSTWAESRKRHLTAEAEAHACGAERERWKERAEAAEADLHGPISALTAADRANITAHLSPDLAPAARLPSRNSVMMDWVKVSNEAATLRAENERLRGERDRQYDENVHRIAEQAKAEGERDALRAKVERLRGALEKINVGEGWAAQIARAALEGKA